MSQWAMKDNYGGKWTSGVKEFLKIYCADWKTRQEIQYALFESLNIWSSKTDEILQSLWGIGMLKFDKEKGYKWSDKQIEPLIKLAEKAFNNEVKGGFKIKVREKEPEELTPEEKAKKAGEMTLYQETKARLAKEKPLTENEEIALGDRKLYKYYTDNCKEDNEEPLTYDLWLTEKYKEQDKTPQKAASEKVLPSINPS